MEKQIKNVAASVRARLINIAEQSKQDYNSILRLYFQERFLYRVSVSPYKQKLILKGALLLMLKDMSRFRPTKDIDFLGKEFSNKIDECKGIIKEIASINCGDGVEFVIDKISAEKIKEEEDYEGVRIHLPYQMDTIKGYLSIDLGFGDKIVQGPYEMEYPVLLDFPSPNLLVYSMESVVAEKFEAIVKLNFISSRMKDFFDLIYIAERTQFKKETLRNAILTTFKHRGTNVDDRKVIYENNFKTDAQKQVQWAAFIERNKLSAENNFAEVVTKISSFIEPVFNTMEKNIWNSKSWIWE
ncbi:MAG: nucleotidyl transferase AbiEii/AbiGii toxin family protein [Ignavibacteriaceae bacterium]|jgi:predicted nucleotidyltransferase component of viral defense system|nr:nucleotidyl transferase AbiEii/AbiGii toxin family protein [Ignavibacteriaceae bacterium]